MSDVSHRHSQGRRGFLKAALGGAVLLFAGAAGAARAEPTKAPNQSPGELKSSCEKYDGVYIESKKDDVQACFWPNKGKTVCKYNGTGCYNYDPPKSAPNPGPFADPFGSVNWPDLEALAGGDDQVAGDPITAVATASPETILGRRRRKRQSKRQGKRRKH